MDVKFVSITPDAEKMMAYIARVSNPSNQQNENYSGLLILIVNQLMKKQEQLHWHFHLKNQFKEILV